MKTNIEFVNNTYATLIGFADFYAGCMEDGDPIIETCDVYRAIDGTVFGYCFVLKEVVEKYGTVHYVDSSYWHYNLKKRGRHSRSNNKKAQRNIRNHNNVVELPF